MVIFLGTEGPRFSTAPQAIDAWDVGRCLSVQAVEAGRLGGLKRFDPLTEQIEFLGPTDFGLIAARSEAHRFAR